LALNTIDFLPGEEKLVEVENPELLNVDSDIDSLGSQRLYYSGHFYREGGGVFVDQPRNDSLTMLELPDADPDSFVHLQGLTGYDKDNFHYLSYDYETRSYVPVSVPMISEIKQMFGSAESPGDDVIIVWNQDADVVFGDVTYQKMSEYSNPNVFRIDIFEILNDGDVIGFLWANGLKKKNMTNNTLYLYTNRAVHEVKYGDQPKKIIDIDSAKTAFMPGGDKISYKII